MILVLVPLLKMRSILWVHLFLDCSSLSPELTLILNPSLEPALLTTADGSPTLVHPTLHQTYHSLHGALTESKIVFIKYGLEFVAQSKSHIHLLEMGFGSGLNALLSWMYANENGITIDYTAVDTYYITAKFADKIDYQITNTDIIQFNELHKLEIGVKKMMSNHFNLLKIEDDWNEFAPKEKFDLIYFDAFSPESQPELWSIDSMAKCYTLLKSDGVLVTYCAKGQVKRNLKAAGFIVDALPGPPRKREVTRARKI